MVQLNKKLKKGIITLTMIAILSTAVFSSGLAASFDGFSSDMPVEPQYITAITAIDSYALVQQVDYEDSGTDSLDLKIDSFTITNEGTITDGDIYKIQLWADGGNGVYDGGGAPPRYDDTLIGSSYHPSLITGEVIGGNNDTACFTIPDGESRMVFLLLALESDCEQNNLEIKTKIDARDLAPHSSSWSKYQGFDVASEVTTTFCSATTQKMYTYDTNNNGIVDEIHVEVWYPIDPATHIWYMHNEGTAISHFTVEYDGDEVDVESIGFIDSTTDSARFKLILEETDPDLEMDTTSNLFSVEYDQYDKELMIGTTYDRSVYLDAILGWWSLLDATGPLVTSLSVSDDMLSSDDSGFEVMASFSEPMNQSRYPVFDFDGPLDEGSSPTLVFDSGFWSDEQTYQANFTVVDAEGFFGDVDVICTTDGVFDANDVQMDSSYIASTLLYVDMKSPVISDWPSGSLMPGYDYTVRISIDDDSGISTVVLDYDFGAGLNTKPMSFDPSSGKYVSVVTPPDSASNLTYRVSAVDVYENTAISAFHNLSVDSDGSDDEGNGTEDSSDDDVSDDGENSDADDGTNMTGDQGDPKGQTPGFEMIGVLCAVGIALLVVMSKKE